MRIRLRPYHPTYVVAHYGGGVPETSRARPGFEAIQRKLRECALDDIEVEIVHAHDEACETCKFRRESDAGSVWGDRHTCTSAEDPKIVAAVDRINEKVLQLLDLQFGSVIPMPELVRRLAERIPVLDDGMLGGPKMQPAYEAGLAALKAREGG